MAKENDRNYVSFWFWFLAFFVLMVPCVGLVMMIVWAFAGENESRKNYFRALIAWLLVFFVFWILLMSVGLFPTVQEGLRELIHNWPPSR